MKLDLYDKKILYELDVNARKSASSIAKKLHISKETVNSKIKRMVAKGYIRRFYTMLNMSKLGYHYYNLFVLFRRTTPAIEEKILSYIKKGRCCANLRDCEGKYDVTFLIMVREMKELKDFLRDFKGKYGRYIQQIEITTIVKTHKLNQKMLIPGKSEIVSFEQDKISSRQIDEKNKKLLKALSTNGRVKLTELAEKTNLEAKTARYRMKKMEEEGIIVGYFTFINHEMVEKENVQVNISLRDPKIIPAMVEFFDTTHRAVFVQELLGMYDISVDLYAENDQRLRQILERFRKKFVKYYNYYEILHVYQEQVIGLSPFKG